MTLLTPQEIADILKLPQRNASTLIRSPGFPPPAVDLSRKLRRWSRDSVESWIKKQENRNT